MANQNNQFDFKNFKGFTSPQYTPVPDLLFDHIMQELNESELKVLLYIIRRTFGFKRDTDNISLNQMAEGITTKDGRVLDRGVGLNRRSVARALASLKEKNLIIAHRRRDSKRGNLPTTYALKMIGDPSDSGNTPPSDSRVTTLVTPESPTINSNTKDSTTTKSLKTTTAKKKDKQQHSRGERSPETSVVVALTEKGISKKVATRLASRYTQDRVLEKVSFLEFLQENDLDKDIKSPLGWLRRAIEDDYAAPAGYAPDWQQQREAKQTARARALEQKAELEAAQMAEKTREQEKQEKIRQEQLQPLRERYSTSEKEKNIWGQALNQLAASDSTGVKLYFAGSELLALQGHEAIIWLPNEYAREQIEDRYVTALQRLLAKQLSVSFQVMNITLVTPEDDSQKQTIKPPQS